MPYNVGMTQLTVTAKGQITLKKALLEGLGARVGDRLQVDVRPDGGLVILPVRRKSRSWSELAGMLKRPGQPVLTIEQMNEAIAEAGAAAGMAGLDDH